MLSLSKVHSKNIMIIIYQRSQVFSSIFMSLFDSNLFVILDRYYCFGYIFMFGICFDMLFLFSGKNEGTMVINPKVIHQSNSRPKSEGKFFVF